MRRDPAVYRFLFKAPMRSDLKPGDLSRCRVLINRKRLHPEVPRELVNRKDVVSMIQSNLTLLYLVLSLLPLLYLCFYCLVFDNFAGLSLIKGRQDSILCAMLCQCIFSKIYQFQHMVGDFLVFYKIWGYLEGFWQDNCEGCSRSYLTLRFDLTSVLLNDRVGNREAKTRALFFVGIKWVKNMLYLVLRNATTGV